MPRWPRLGRIRGPRRGRRGATLRTTAVQTEGIDGEEAGEGARRRRDPVPAGGRHAGRGRRRERRVGGRRRRCREARQGAPEEDRGSRRGAREGTPPARAPAGASRGDPAGGPRARARAGCDAAGGARPRRCPAGDRGAARPPAAARTPYGRDPRAFRRRRLPAGSGQVASRGHARRSRPVTRPGPGGAGGSRPSSHPGGEDHPRTAEASQTRRRRHRRRRLRDRPRPSRPRRPPPPPHRPPPPR
jgi:hypothetical protein